MTNRHLRGHKHHDGAAALTQRYFSPPSTFVEVLRDFLKCCGHISKLVAFSISGRFRNSCTTKHDIVDDRATSEATVMSKLTFGKFR